VRAPSGACSLALHREAGEAAQRGRVAELSLSMSHEAEYATAVVIARLGRRLRRDAAPALRLAAGLAPASRRPRSPMGRIPTGGLT